MSKLEKLLAVLEAIPNIIINRGQNDEACLWTCIRIPKQGDYAFCDNYTDITFFDEEFDGILVY